MKNSFAKRVFEFHKNLDPTQKLPPGITWIDAYKNPDTAITFLRFLEQFYADNDDRTFLFGINPGRFGAGVTGVAFTDPILLEEKCGISSPFVKKHELSALFIHEMIETFGGVNRFYKHFYITSLSPLGLLKDGKNYNYYDDKETLRLTKPFIIKCINAQIQFGCNNKKAFCLGQGKNFKVFSALNNTHNWFQEIIPLPHPRWIMQYRRKRKNEFLDEYLQKLSS